MANRVVIALTLFISMLLMGILAGTVNAVTLQRMEEQRLRSVTARLRETLETDLRVGIALADNEHAQARIEDAVAHAPKVESLEIDSEDGRVLFSSDRILRGDSVPPAWHEAMRASPGGWHVIRAGEHSLATALHDAAGQVVGYLVLTHQTEDDEKAVILPAPLLWAAATLGLLALLMGWRTERLCRVLDPAADHSVRNVMGFVDDARSAIARVNDEAHRIAGLEP